MKCITAFFCWAFVAIHVRQISALSLPRGYHIGLFLDTKITPSAQFMINWFSSLSTLNDSQADLNILPGILNTPSHDSGEIWRTTCERLKLGFMMMMAAGDSYSAQSFAELAEHVQMPFINLHLPPKVLSHHSFAQNKFVVSVRPPNDQLLADWIYRRRWTQLTFMHDNEDGLLNMKLIFERLHRMPRRKDFPDILSDILKIPDDKRRFKDFLYDFHMNRYNFTGGPVQVIVQCSSSSRQSAFIGALESVSLQSPEKFHFVLANFDIADADLQKLRVRFVNFTTFHLINKQSATYNKTLRAFDTFIEEKIKADAESRIYHRKSTLVDTSHLPIESALLHDAFQVAVETIKLAEQNNLLNLSKLYHRNKFINFGAQGIFCIPSDDQSDKHRQFRPFIYGNNITTQLRKISLSPHRTLTGPIKFNKQGIREKFRVEVTTFSYDLVTAMPMEQVLSWSDVEGFQVIRETAAREQANATLEKKLVITTVRSMPFAMLAAYNPLTNEVKLHGYCIELAAMLSKIMNFEYEIRLVRDGQFGGVNEDKTWNGMVGELLREEADMAIAPLTITRERERVVDFSKPFIYTGISIMTKKPEKIELEIFSFLGPLSRRVWVFMLLAYIGVSIVIYWVAKISPYEVNANERQQLQLNIGNELSMYNCFWFTLAAFMQQGTEIAPRSLSARVASSAWWFWTMIMVASYTANLAAFLTAEKMSTGINSVDDLAKQSKIKYGIQGGGSTEAFFRTSTVPMYQRMWEYMSKHPSVLVSNYNEGIQRVRDSKGKYAFLLEATANLFASTRKPCDTIKVGEPLNTAGYGVATRIGWPHKRALNMAILYLHERGELKKLENTWWYDKGECELNAHSDGGTASLTMNHVLGVFYVLIIGLGTAMCASALEFMYRLRQELQKRQLLSHHLT